MKSRAPRGEGSVDPLPSGRWRARLWVDGKRRPLGIYDTEEEARRALAAAVALLQESDTSRVGSAVTLAVYGNRWLDAREARKVRSVDVERSRFRVHVLNAPFASWPMASIGRQDYKAFLESLPKKNVSLQRFGKRSKPRKISATTTKHVRTLLHGILQSAVEDCLIASNPIADLKLKLPAAEREPWTYLSPSEINKLATAEIIPYAYRLMIGIAILTGMRESEMWCLHLDDLHLDAAEPHLMVRWGGRKGGEYTLPKNKKVRSVPLLPSAVDLLQKWLDQLPQFARRNPFGLAFPSEMGGHRPMKKAPRHWNEWVDKLGIMGMTGAPVVWHSLRHTCASALVSGWWGRCWTLKEVQVQLGHRSFQSTERYAHLAQSAVARAAAETQGHVVVTVTASDGKTIRLLQATEPLASPSPRSPPQMRSRMRTRHRRSRGQTCIPPRRTQGHRPTRRSPTFGSTLGQGYTMRSDRPRTGGVSRLPAGTHARLAPAHSDLDQPTLLAPLVARQTSLVTPSPRLPQCPDRDQ